MKSRRQEKIINLVTRYEIDTQEELIGMLRREGYDVTQATVSRDIRELKLTKVPTGRGSYRYTIPSKDDREPTFKFNSVLVESIKKVDFSGNIVVLKTFAGLAQAVATGLDAIESHDILGCVAGDDCIILVARTHEAAKDISERIKTMLKSI